MIDDTLIISLLQQTNQQLVELVALFQFIAGEIKKQTKYKRGTDGNNNSRSPGTKIS